MNEWHTTEVNIEERVLLFKLKDGLAKDQMTVNLPWINLEGKLEEGSLSIQEVGFWNCLRKREGTE